MVNKQAKSRTKSKDPVQEALRQHKDAWNASCSFFITKLIAFKRGINGRGDLKFGLPPSSLKEPLPREVGSSLSDLAGLFDKIVSDAASIVKQQESYSKTRKQKHQEDPRQPLQVAASNAVTRSWSRFFSSKEFKKHRLSMLKLCVILEKKIKKFEDDILVKSIEKTPEIVESLQSFRSDFEVLKESFINLQKNRSKPKEQNTQNSSSENDTYQETSEVKPQEEVSQPAIDKDKPLTPAKLINVSLKAQVQKIIKDLQYGLELSVSPETIINLRELAKEFVKAENEGKQEVIFERMKEQYDQICKALSSKYVMDQISTLEEITKSKDKKKASIKQESNMIQKTALNFLSKFLAKKILKNFSNDETSAYRIEIVNSVEKIKKDLNELMDLLEQGLDFEIVGLKLNEINQLVKEINPNMSLINSLYKNYYYGKEDKKKSLLDSVLNRKIKQDMSKDF